MFDRRAAHRARHSHDGGAVMTDACNVAYSRWPCNKNDRRRSRTTWRPVYAAGWGNRPMNRLRRKKAETVLSEELNRPMNFLSLSRQYSPSTVTCRTRGRTRTCNPLVRRIAPHGLRDCGWNRTTWNRLMRPAAVPSAGTPQSGVLPLPELNRGRPRDNRPCCHYTKGDSDI